MPFVGSGIVIVSDWGLPADGIDAMRCLKLSGRLWRCQNVKMALKSIYFVTIRATDGLKAKTDSQPSGKGCRSCKLQAWTKTYANTI